MKVALVILHADPARGGAERYTVDLAAALHARGVEVSLVASTVAAGPAGRPVALPVRSATRLGYYLKFLDALDDHLSRETYDVVHAMLPVRRCDVYHPHAGLAADAVVTGHEKYDGVRRSFAGLANQFNRKRRRFAAVERRLLDSPDAPVVLCLSEYIKATVRKHYPALPESRLATLFNAVDLTRFNPAAVTAPTPGLREQYGLPANAVLSLMIAQDFRRKGLMEAIKAIPSDDPRIVLFVMGKQRAAGYERLARERGVRDQLVMLGPRPDPRPFYRAADFFVLPTRHDPCSLVVLEALAMGLPVISTVYNGACEIMTDGVHGFVLPDPRDVDALADRYRRMLDPTRRRAMSDACLALRPRFSQDHHLEQLLGIYEALPRK